MLVLTRKIGEEIVIDGETTVRIIQCSGGRVRIAIDAPRHVKIARAELCDFGWGAQREENQSLTEVVSES